MKKSTILIKAFSLALVLLMLVSMLPACNKQGEGEKTEEKSQNANAVDTDENGIPLDALPDNLNFNREFSILGNDNRKHHRIHQQSYLLKKYNRQPSLKVG